MEKILNTRSNIIFENEFQKLHKALTRYVRLTSKLSHENNEKKTKRYTYKKGKILFKSRM